MKTLEEMTEKELERMERLLSMVLGTIAIEKRSDVEIINMATEYYNDLPMDSPLAILLFELITRLEDALNINQEPDDE